MNARVHGPSPSVRPHISVIGGVLWFVYLISMSQILSKHNIKSNDKVSLLPMNYCYDYMSCREGM